MYDVLFSGTSSGSRCKDRRVSHIKWDKFWEQHMVFVSGRLRGRCSRTLSIAGRFGVLHDRHCRAQSPTYSYVTLTITCGVVPSFPTQHHFEAQ